MRAVLIAVVVALWSMSASAAECELPARVMDEAMVGADRDALRSLQNTNGEEVERLKRAHLVWSVPAGTPVCMLSPGGAYDYVVAVKFVDGTVGVISERALHTIGWGEHR